MQTIEFTWRSKSFRYTGEALLMLLAIHPSGKPVLVARADDQGWNATHGYACTFPYYVQPVPDATGQTWGWPPSPGAWLYGLPGNLMVDPPPLEKPHPRYTAAQSALTNQPLAAHDTSLLRVDPNYLSANCATKMRWKLECSGSGTEESSRLHSCLKKSLKILLAAVAATQITACSRTVQWEEEVPLNTRETILVKRTDSYVKGGEPGNPMKMTWGLEKRAYEFSWHGQNYTYHTDPQVSLGAILIHVFVADETSPSSMPHETASNRGSENFVGEMADGNFNAMWITHSSVGRAISWGSTPRMKVTYLRASTRNSSSARTPPRIEERKP